MAKDKTENIYDDMHALPADLSDALDAAMKRGRATYQDQAITPQPIQEAGLFTLRNGSEVTWILNPYGRGKKIHWVPVCRFDKKKIGSYDFWIGRPSLAPPTITSVAALEAAHGRDGAIHYVSQPLREGESCTPVSVDAAALDRGMSKILYVRARGLWFSALTQRYRRRPVQEAPIAPAGGEAFPKLAIV